MFNMPLLQGLIAAPFTPLKADGTLNLDQVGRYAEHLATCGVAGAFVGYRPQRLEVVHLQVERQAVIRFGQCPEIASRGSRARTMCSTREAW